MIKVSVGLAFADAAVGTDLRDILDLARICDDKGADLINVPDHVAIGAFDPDAYPGVDKAKGALPFEIEQPWPESVALMAGIAAVTSRIRILSNILIGPLRPAVLFAKQIGTVDCISNGRVELGIGAGWQKAEFDACGMTFENRFAYMDEQIEACRVLWRVAPATFEARHIRFKDLYVLPLPPQRDKIPVWLGVATTERGCRRLAKYADGWMANTRRVDRIVDSVARIRFALIEAGRDPNEMNVHAELEVIKRPDGNVDFDAMIDSIPSMIDAGVTVISITPGRYCRGLKECEELIERIVAIKENHGVAET